MTRAQEIVASWKQHMRLPAIVAPMFLVSGPELVLASCRAGLMGCFPGPNARTIDDLREWFTEITSALDAIRAEGINPAPWAFNMITHKSYERFEAELALVEEFQPALVISALGGPQRLLPSVHAYGGLVFADVIDVSYARKAAEAGADGLVLVCAGAGGHTGQYSPFAFFDEVRRFFDGPIIIGGAISHGRSVRAVEILGADFAYLGTRFIATPESLAAPGYQDMVVDLDIGDIVQTRAVTGANANFMWPSIEAAGFTREQLRAEKKVDLSGDAMSETKLWKHTWSAGQGLGTVQAVQPVAEIAEELMREYRAALRA